MLSNPNPNSQPSTIKLTELIHPPTTRHPTERVPLLNMTWIKAMVSHSTSSPPTKAPRSKSVLMLLFLEFATNSSVAAFHSPSCSTALTVQSINSNHALWAQAEVECAGVGSYLDESQVRLFICWLSVLLGFNYPHHQPNPTSHSITRSSSFARHTSTSIINPIFCSHLPAFFQSWAPYPSRKTCGWADPTP